MQVEMAAATASLMADVNVVSPSLPANHPSKLWSIFPVSQKMTPCKDISIGTIF